MPMLIAVAVIIVFVGIMDAAKHALASTAVLLTDIIDGVLIFSLSILAAIVIALVVWIASHAGRAMWKYRGDYGLRNLAPVTQSPQNGVYATAYENGIETVQTTEINGVYVPMAINAAPAVNPTDYVLDDLLTEKVPVRKKDRFTLRRD